MKKSKFRRLTREERNRLVAEHAEEWLERIKFGQLFSVARAKPYGRIARSNKEVRHASAHEIYS